MSARKGAEEAMKAQAEHFTEELERKEGEFKKQVSNNGNMF